MLVFDKFHIVSHLMKAVDQVRRDEIREKGPAHKALMHKTRFIWLKNPWNLTEAQHRRLSELEHLNLKINRAYLLKELFAQAVLVFDKFHIVSHLMKAVDQVRRDEIREKGPAHKALAQDALLDLPPRRLGQAVPEALVLVGHAFTPATAERLRLDAAPPREGHPQLLPHAHRQRYR